MNPRIFESHVNKQFAIFVVHWEISKNPSSIFSNVKYFFAVYNNKILELGSTT